MSASPNPFASETSIIFTLKQTSEVLMEITDLSGRKITTLVNGLMTEGNHSFGFIPSQYGLTSGVYILKASIGDVSSKIKLVNY
jgi:histidine ammonia-lyase